MSLKDLASRAGAWIVRYGPPELLGTAGALAGAALAFELSGSLAAAAVAANWAEFVCYYGYLFWRSLPAGGRPTARASLVALRNLLIEFGPAELIGGTLLRPAALYAALALAPSLAIGALLGKLAADLCFYVPAVIAYELRVRLLPEAPPAARGERVGHGCAAGGRHQPSQRAAAKTVTRFRTLS